MGLKCLEKAEFRQKCLEKPEFRLRLFLLDVAQGREKEADLLLKEADLLLSELDVAQGREKEADLLLSESVDRVLPVSEV